MATRVQRAKSILEALNDPVPITNALALRVATAFAYTYRRSETLTVEQQAGVLIFQIRNFIKQVIRDAEISQALETERVRVAPGAEIAIGTDEI